MISAMQKVSVSRPTVQINKAQLRGGVAALKPVPVARRTQRAALATRAMAQGPLGLPEPAKEPANIVPSTFGFYTAAEVINGRAAMIGIFALCAVEAVFGKGILVMLGYQVGNGINIGF
mmetsp:Transcript_37217/g.81041  ORF Transcript_37217/g.81041 Transcript_37217/m.81041 type:complete len:119 (-) Transcript_37217:221-577(-)|eukprot:CAMPEP_0118933860 /NCGR_PEP_ID=MMETSP1169-20130426/12736_1 /TAXON_ID=36882 /ORGANISM="Pyramimonas obovata, Strain CCMP722" /LENGTH=118 /DNA_ID=CAMNT_0006876679 /DNA_START=61 /DNA_END=417 /DNA_ORIENTATION=+